MRLTNLYLEEERYNDVVALNRDNIDNVLQKVGLKQVMLITSA